MDPDLANTCFFTNKVFDVRQTLLKIDLFGNLSKDIEVPMMQLLQGHIELDSNWITRSCLSFKNNQHMILNKFVAVKSSCVCCLRTSRSLP